MTLARVLRLTPAGWRRLQAHWDGGSLLTPNDDELAQRGLTDEHGLTPHGHELARCCITLATILSVRPTDLPNILPRITPHIDSLLLARAGTLDPDATPAALEQFRLVKNAARLTLRGAAVLNTLEDLAKALDTYLL